MVVAQPATNDAHSSGRPNTAITEVRTIERAESDTLRSMLRRFFSGVAAALWLAVMGCASPSADDVAGAERSIVGGTTASACSWPSTVLAGGCSGALVHPRLVVTAAHCVPDGITDVDFGESASRLARIVNVARCSAHPSYNGNTDDIGFCLLAEDVTGVPIVPVMATCEAAVLRAGAAAMEVGFGQAVPTTGANDGFGIKRWTAATIRTVANNRGQIDATTGTQNGEYFGDSGGPLFFQMPDGTWRLIGADSSSPNIIPGSAAARVSTYTSVPTHLAWLETTSGVDLTPCHDADGWNPTAACAGFPTNPADGVGAWPSMCAGQTLVMPQPTCGGTNTGGASGGGAGATGGNAGTGGTGTGGRSSDGGVADAGTGGRATDASATGGSGGAPGTGGATGSDASGAGGAVAGAGGSLGGTGTSSPPRSGDLSSSGCACATAPSGGSGAAQGLLAMLAIRLACRRRSRRPSVARIRLLWPMRPRFP